MNRALQSCLTTPAMFSDCRKYRYTLLRKWDSGNKMCQFIGLNPSTADEINNDPTIRRCIRYAKEWGYDGMYMTNLFVYRATNPSDMKQQDDPIGSDNDAYLLYISHNVETTIAVWGNGGVYKSRDKTVLSMITPIYYLHITQQNTPAHPLYLPSYLTPKLYNIT